MKPSRNIWNSTVHKIILSIVIVLFSVTAGLATAQQDPETNIRTLATEVMSPFCPGKLLEDCPSGQASELKNEMLSQLKSGKSNEDVKAWFVSRYGSEMLAAPEAKGIGLFAWLMPVAFVVLGSLILMRWISAHKSQ